MEKSIGASDLYNRLQVFGGFLLLDARNSITDTTSAEDMKLRGAVHVPSPSPGTSADVIGGSILVAVGQALAEPDRLRFCRRRLVEICIYTDENDQWARCLQDLLLEEGSASRVQLLTESFQTFRLLYPFLCARTSETSQQNYVEGTTPPEKITCYPNEIESGFLFLGNRRQAQDETIVLQDLQITHVVDLHDEDVPASRPFESRGLEYLTISIWDRETSDIRPHLPPIYDFIERAKRHACSSRVLVHCNHGVSRSATCVIYYLMRSRSIALTTALQHVHGAREVIYPNQAFVQQLLQVEMDILGQQSDPNHLQLVSNRGYLDLRPPVLPHSERSCCLM